MIFANPIEGKDKERLVHLFTSCAFPMVIVEKERLYINTVTDQVKRAQKAISSTVPEVAKYHDQPFYQCTAFIDEQKTHQLARELTNCVITRWNPYGVDIISKQGGKDKGIQAMLAYFGMNAQETMSFGDGQNDKEMLQYTKIGVAMQEADPVAKKAADFVTKSAKDDGIVYALKHYGIL